METDDDIMTAEEFFGGFDGPKAAPRKCRTRGKKPEALFEAVKERMIMRIYGVSRAKAQEIIAQHEARKTAPDEDDDEGAGADRPTPEDRSGDFISPADFFGEVD